MEGAQVAAAGAGANTLGKYRLIAELGHGGMAEVFLSVVRGPAGFNKLVVIKQIRPQLAEDPEFLGMFLDEARLAARLSHPNVVQTNEVGQEGERYFIAMEYLEGQPLNRVIHRLQKGGGLPLVMHLKIVCDTLAGLQHAHELCDYDGTPLGVVHRDVTPHNIFITYDGQVKVVDFGIAKALNSSSETRSGVLKGKVAYMAPEQARGERVDRRADVFSVGVMIWEAATGKRLWKGVPDITILQRLLAGEIPTARSVKAEVPEALDEIIQKALSHQREDRYETAADLQLAVEGYLESIGERVHERDVGKLIVSYFEADRAKIKGIIDEQLRSKGNAGIDVAALPIIDTSTHSGSGPASGRSSSSSISGASGGKVEIIGAGSGSSPSYSGQSALFTSSGPAPGDGPARSRRGLVAAGAVAAGAVLAVVFWQMTKSPAQPTAAADGGSASAVVPATTAPSTKAPGATDVEVSVSARPPEAKIYLDDKLLAGNPWKGKLQKDGASHTIRIEAPGHVTKTDTLTFERDRMMDIVLAKEPDKPTKTHVAAPPPPPPETPRPGKKPLRTLDSSNPYK